MVNNCVCGGCTNSSQSGHRVHHFPSRKRESFQAWVRFVQQKSLGFTAESVTAHSVICGAHFTQESYESGDLMEFRMGYRCQDRVRLLKDAVPSVYASTPQLEAGTVSCQAGDNSPGEPLTREVSTANPVFFTLWLSCFQPLYSTSHCVDLV